MSAPNSEQKSRRGPLVSNQQPAPVRRHTEVQFGKKCPKAMQQLQASSYNRTHLPSVKYKAYTSCVSFNFVHSLSDNFTYFHSTCRVSAKATMSLVEQCLPGPKQTGGNSTRNSYKAERIYIIHCVVLL